MIRKKNLVFRTYNQFTEWYLKMSRKFIKLKLIYLKLFRSSTYIAVTISY